MAILDTLLLLFKADTTDLKKKSEEAETVTKKTAKALSETAKASDAVGASFLNLAKSFGGFLAATISVGSVIAGIKASANYSYELDQASRALNINVEALDAWGNAVQRTGGSAAGLQGSLRGLASHLGTTAETALRILPRLADTFHQLGTTRSLLYGKQLGLDEGTILLLQKGRREVEAIIAQQKELGVVTKRDAEISEKFNYALNDTSHAFRSLYIAVGSTVLPILTRFLTAVIPIVEYLRKHADLVIGALIGIAVAATLMAIPFLVANAALIATVAGVSALIAVFALLYEDIKAFADGQRSLTGELLGRWPAVGNAIKSAFEGVKDVIESSILLPLQAALKIAEKIGSFFGLGGNKEVTAWVKTGQDNLNIASGSLLGSQTSNSIVNNRRGGNPVTLTVSELNIQTQATDSEGIAGGIASELTNQLAQVNNQNANGIIA